MDVLREIRIIVINLGSAEPLKKFDDAQGRRLAQVIDIPLVSVAGNEDPGILN
jgi:hypothetical protein